MAGLAAPSRYVTTEPPPLLGMIRPVGGVLPLLHFGSTSIKPAFVALIRPTLPCLCDQHRARKVEPQVGAVMGNRWLVRVFLVTWAASLTVVGACLMAGHWIPLPGISGDEVSNSPGFSQSIPAEKWSVLHFIYAECPCSRRVLDHVLATGPSQRLHEQIVLVGGDEAIAIQIRHLGFEVDQITPEQLAGKYAVKAAPMMVVVDPNRKVRYAGGYTSRKQAYEIHYLRIASELLDGKVVERLPVYGCAVSRELKAIVDPLGLKSSSRD